jgi:hypothetical protein
VQDDAEIALTTSFGRRQIIDVPKAQGEHGGGDDRLRDLMFHNLAVPEHMRLPDSRAGAMSCLIGIAARKSIEQKRTIRIADLVRL